MANVFTEELSTIGSGSLSTTADVMATPVGGVIYFVVALLIIALITGVVVGIIKWAKSLSGNGMGGKKSYKRRK